MLDHGKDIDYRLYTFTGEQFGAYIQHSMGQLLLYIAGLPGTSDRWGIIHVDKRSHNVNA